MDPNIIASLSPEELNALWALPASEPPAGTERHFGITEHNKNLAIGVTITFAVLVGLAFVLRCSHRLIMRKVYLEDWLLLLSLGFYAGFLYEIYMLGIQFYHVHQWNITLRQISHLLRSSNIMITMHALTMMFLKIAILISWMRLFVPTKQRNWFYITSYFLICATTLFYSIGALAEIFQCTPREKIWNPLLVGGHCPIDISRLAKASGLLNLLSDVIILCLPQVVVWNLNLPTKKKVGISLIFIMGLFALAAAVIRTYYLFKIYSGPLRSNLQDGPDIVYHGGDLVFWMGAELVTGFLVATLPSLPKVIKTQPWLHNLFSSLRVLVPYKLLKVSKEPKQDSRRGLPSWFKSPTRQPRRVDPFAISMSLGGTSSELMFIPGSRIGDQPIFHRINEGDGCPVTSAKSSVDTIEFRLV